MGAGRWEQGEGRKKLTRRILTPNPMFAKDKQKLFIDSKNYKNLCSPLIHSFVVA